MADSLDMLADSFVYGLSLWAVGSTVLRKKKVARLSGYFQLTLALLGIFEVVRRFIGFEAMPDYRIMIGVSILALIANAICLIRNYFSFLSSVKLKFETDSVFIHCRLN